MIPHHTKLGFVDRFREGLLGRLYFNRLQKIPTVKRIASTVWRVVIFVYHFFWIYWRSPHFQLVEMDRLAEPSRRRILLHAQDVCGKSPVVYPAEKFSLIQPAQGSYRFPAVSVDRLIHATVIGGSNFVISGSKMAHHALYDFSSDVTSEELNMRARIWRKSKTVAWLERGETESLVLENAACFTDAASHNYAHWLTEVLPRIHLFCQVEDFKKIDLIVDSALHPNIIESLSLVVGIERKIHRLTKSAFANVRNLYLTAPAGYIPIERLRKDDCGHSHGKFHSLAIFEMARILRLNIAEDIPPADKIYIRRNSHLRNLDNYSEIEQHLLTEGFLIVDPENLTFTQQVTLFSRARVIVGPTGAAFANIIFCNQKTDIIILISDFPQMPFWYWQNIANAVGCSVSYVIGYCTERRSHVHSNFSINIDDLRSALYSLADSRTKCNTG